MTLELTEDEQYYEEIVDGLLTFIEKGVVPIEEEHKAFLASKRVFCPPLSVWIGVSSSYCKKFRPERTVLMSAS